MLLRPRLAVLFVSICALSRAQSPLATVTGLASDPASAAVVNATVTLRNTETGVKHNAATNGSGLYNISNLPSGTYELSATAQGFGALAIATFNVDPYRTVRQELHFAVATASTNVTVS